MSFRRLVPTTALAAALALVPTAALAQTETTPTTRPARPERTGERAGERREQLIERVKARCLSQIERRQRALGAERERLSNAKALTDAHRSALLRINESVSNGLAALADEIQAEDNGEDLRAECRRIVDDFRVFTLVRPRSRLVLASDRELRAVTRLTEVAAKIDSKIAEAKADGRDTANAEAELTKMRQAIATAQGKASAVYDSVIGLTPADYNADHAVLEAARDAVRAGGEAVRAAVKAGRAAMQSLRSETPEA
jgi:hypothetical protein